MRKAGRGRIGVLQSPPCRARPPTRRDALKRVRVQREKGKCGGASAHRGLPRAVSGAGACCSSTVMGIPMGFYNIPIVVDRFWWRILVACLPEPRRFPLTTSSSSWGEGIGDKTIVTMILIFMAAGVFVGTVGRDSARVGGLPHARRSSPPEFSVAGAVCGRAASYPLSMGTLGGHHHAHHAHRRGGGGRRSGFEHCRCVLASVMGGAMFGDNLSFISDTTIAACQGQGCQMRDKFTGELQDRPAGGAWRRWR